jgi:hypothetical protein
MEPPTTPNIHSKEEDNLILEGACVYAEYIIRRPGYLVVEKYTVRG